jgi:hypothetical protein
MMRSYELVKRSAGRQEHLTEYLGITLEVARPSDSPGLGPEFQHLSALDFVLQELRRFPGKGWRLIQAGLQSPTVRNRNVAVQALATWDRALWAAEAQALLRRAIAAEPMDRTRAIMEKVLAGEVLAGN